MAQINQFTNEQGAQFIDNSHSIITVSPEGTKISQTFHSEEKKKGGASDTFTGKPLVRMLLIRKAKVRTLASFPTARWSS